MKHAPKERSQRQLRVGEQVRHVLVEVIREGGIPHEDLFEIDGLTIGEVRISPDLKNATAFASAFSIDDMSPIIEALNQTHSYFQTEVNKRLNLKFTPRIKFVYDKSVDEADRIEMLLNKIHTEQK